VNANYAQDVGDFSGPVECSSQGGGDTTTQSSMGGNSQDGDGDGILDANDNCPNLSHTRCYKEGDTAIIVHNSNR
jgi:Thrombospondin type 3 repeat